jgi:hypothetical protein
MQPLIDRCHQLSRLTQRIIEYLAANRFNPSLINVPFPGEIVLEILTVLQKSTLMLIDPLTRVPAIRPERIERQLDDASTHSAQTASKCHAHLNTSYILDTIDVKRDRLLAANEY